ncbi:MerR family transcriptional regulator [Kitasatospora camelliae]|uniref:MerR family transcriptional regulator n=1 Tax=Kitasatospora camelliae TaxID=3156397 RepID=A0AAU8JRJ6_9ACTN
MDGDTLHTIGDLARRTGLTVKAIRFYSDCGLLPPTRRSPAGHRRYGPDASARLDLVRTLRDLGLDLATIRKVADRELSLPEVAAAHAEALDVQIRTLRLRHAVLTAVARRGAGTEETGPIHRLARLTEDERRRLTEEFLDAAFGRRADADADADSNADADPGGSVERGVRAPDALAAARRSMTPELPEEPDTEQVLAWLEAAELAQDPGFRAALRRMARNQAEDSAGAGTGAGNGAVLPRRDAVALARDLAGPALAAGLPPASPEADPVLAQLTAAYARLLHAPDDQALRHRLLARLETANDPRRQRYTELLAVINGWPAPEDLTPVLDWTARALRARIPASAPI